MLAGGGGDAAGSAAGGAAGAARHRAPGRTGKATRRAAPHPPVPGELRLRPAPSAVWWMSPCRARQRRLPRAQGRAGALPSATRPHVASTASAWVAVCTDLLEAAKDRTNLDRASVRH